MTKPIEPVMFATCTALVLADGSPAIVVDATEDQDCDSMSPEARADWLEALRLLGFDPDGDDYEFDYRERGTLGLYTFRPVA